MTTNKTRKLISVKSQLDWVFELELEKLIFSFVIREIKFPKNKYLIFVWAELADSFSKY
jgi:hypothetical protein